MNLDDFRKDFLERVKSHAAAECDLTQSAFVTVASDELMEAEEFSDFASSYYEGSGVHDRRLRLRVDGYEYDDMDCSMKLLIADFRGGDETATLTVTEATTQFSRLKAFLSEALSGELHRELEDSSPVYALASDIHNRQTSIMRFRFFLVTDAILSSRTKDWPQESVFNIPVEFHIWDIARFHRAFESTSGRDDLSIDFRNFTQNGIPCLKASQSTGEYEAYLCVIPGVILADLYDCYGSRLLERNVRAFLGIRGSKSVNSGIRNTIMKQPSMFFAYNNGIAATASGAELVQSEEGLYITRVSDLQIVNGGQTTASLSTSRRKDRIELNDIFVQMKLSVVPPDYANEVIPRISRCANSQNKVSDADFFSNHPFHVRLELHSRRIWAPAKAGTQHETHWFYERARGQFLNEQAKLTPSEKNRFLQQNPREQLLTKTDLAKYENAWRCLPNVVSFGAQKNFRKFAEWIEQCWNISDTDFNEEYFRNAVAKAILWKSTERLVSQQSWYQKGYRANIVAYTVSKLSQIISAREKEKYLNLRNIWNQQRISPALEMQLIVISKAVLEVFVDPARVIENVTEWCKKELCWQKVEQLDISLIPEFSMELVDKDVLIHATRDAKAVQKIDNGIEAQSIVISLGSSYWQSLFSWSKEKKIFSPDDESVIKVAAGIPKKIPTEKQCKWLLNLKVKAEAEGFEQ